MTHLATTLYINQLYQQQMPKIALAGEGGFIDNVIGGIKSYVSELWDGERPLASIISFLGPGLIFKLGFPWLAVAYEVAGALGFDWIGFWDSLKNSVYDIVKKVITPGTAKPTEEEVHEQVSQATAEGLDRNMHDKIDEQRLGELKNKADAQMPAVTGAESTSQLIKQAGIFGAAARSRGILSTIFKRIIPWVVTRALIALGFATAGGAARGALGIKSGPKDDKGETTIDNGSSKVRDPIFNYPVSKSADPSLFEFHKNDVSSVWLETGSINDIGTIMWSWVSSAFPQFDKEENKITNSGSFIQVENMFRDRNKLASGLQIYSVPKPFQRKIDIVSYIVNGYLKTRGNDAPKTQ